MPAYPSFSLIPGLAAGFYEHVRPAKPPIES